MNYSKLKELVLLLEKHQSLKVSMMVVNEDYTDVYFEGNNAEAMDDLESKWDFKCEMHNSNDSYVRFNF